MPHADAACQQRSTAVVRADAVFHARRTRGGVTLRARRSVSMRRVFLRSPARQTGSALAQWAIALASIGVVALAAINLFRG
jgi:hypothetical protein